MVRRLGKALLERGLSAERPLLILSGNEIEHALLALAAHHVGVPYAPVSPAYSLVSQDFGRLRYVVELLTPGLVYASDGRAFARRSPPRYRLRWRSRPAQATCWIAPPHRCPTSWRRPPPPRSTRLTTPCGRKRLPSSC